MKRSEIVEIIHDICVNCDDRNYGERWERGLKEAIKELEGTRSIAEVRAKRDGREKEREKDWEQMTDDEVDGLHSGFIEATEWFLKEEE